MDVESLSEQLGGRMVLWLEETDSTMLDAARLAMAGCPSGTVVGAERQTAGQGRHGRTWHSEPAAGLYFSVVLRMTLPPEQLPVVTMAAGLATAEAITHTTSLAIDLRWPNDGMVGDRKLFGILVQQQDTALVCGIGINVNHTVFPSELSRIATSVRAETGRETPREPILRQTLLALDQHCDLLRAEGPAPLLRLFSRASSYASGRRVVVELSDGDVHGVTEGLDENGFLLLRQDDGTRRTILAGGVRPA